MTPTPAEGAAMRPVLELMDQFQDATAGTVAALLERVGITGYRRSSISCPVANYLVERTGTPVAVTRGHCHLRANLGVSFRMPAPLTEFVERFDAGEWAQLRHDTTPATRVESTP